MIRNIIILVTTLAALGTAVAYIVSYKKTIHWSTDLTSQRHVCIEAVQGYVYMHSVYSDRQSFLGTVDAHEHGSQLKPRTGIVSYGEQDPAFVPGALGPPDPDPASIPMITYAWSNRIGLPMWLPLIVLALYPSLTLIRMHSRRGLLGFDPRIRSTKARAAFASLVGTILVPVGYIPGSLLGLTWLHDVHGVSMWIALPTVIVLSFFPVICVAIWVFWRLTPGDHGGPLWRRRRRLLRERGLCLCCGYDLTGNESGICPECGKAAGSEQSE